MLYAPAPWPIVLPCLVQQQCQCFCSAYCTRLMKRATLPCRSQGSYNEWVLMTQLHFSSAIAQPGDMAHPCCAHLQGLLEGTKDSLMPWVCDVRDIARAHIRAAEIPAAKGRHIVSQGATVPTKRLVDALSKAFPDFKFPSVKDEASKDVIDNTKVGVGAAPRPFATLYGSTRQGTEHRAGRPALDRPPWQGVIGQSLQCVLPKTHRAELHMSSDVSFPGCAAGS